MAKNKGWICPQCNQGVNPKRDTCPCVPQLPKTITRYWCPTCQTYSESWHYWHHSSPGIQIWPNTWTTNSTSYWLDLPKPEN